MAIVYLLVFGGLMFFLGGVVMGKLEEWNERVERELTLKEEEEKQAWINKR